MKKSIITFCFLFFYHVLSAQVRQNVSFSFLRFFVTTNNFQLHYAKQKGKKEWGIGLKYHLNPVDDEEIGHIIGQSFNSDVLAENFGLMGTYKRYWFSEQKKWTDFIAPYFTYHTEFTYKQTKAVWYVVDALTEIMNFQSVSYGRILGWENNIGIGIKFFQKKKLNLFIQAGGGFSFAYGVPWYADIFKIPKTTWEYSHMYGGGITYNLSTQLPEKKKRKK